MSIEFPPGYTRESLLATVDRELRLRERAYPRWVQLGRMTGVKMREEIAAMKAVRTVLASLPEAPPVQSDLFGAKQ